MISTHVLDTATGRPAAGVHVTLQARAPDGAWTTLHTESTDADGRVRQLGGPAGLGTGAHRLVFDTGGYLGEDAFFTEAIVSFTVSGEEQLHVPLLLSPYSLSVYRGS
jgi:5-hydroxyisourate hydrolase